MAAERTGNLVLDDLPAYVRNQCMGRGERVRVAIGEELVRQDERATRTFFPATAVAALTVELKSGDKAEAGTVGREGFIGLAFLDARGVCPFSAVVRLPGEGYMVSQATLSSLMGKAVELRKAVLAYAGFTLNVVGRSIACNAYHSLEQRLARWLLTTHDHVDADEFPLTHEMLSQMLGATRPRVSLAAGRLRKGRIIDYRRGQVTILDRARLEERSCECYQSTYRALRTLPWVRT